MELSQITKMIEWLDEERRRDKGTIATLQERLAQQQDVIDTLTKRLGGIEADQTRLEVRTLPSSREAEITEQLRQEMQRMAEQIESRRLNAEREVERRQQLTLDAASRAVRDINEKLMKLERQTTELPAINVEKDRLSGSVAGLQQRIDDLYRRLEEPDRRIIHLEEQRRQDIKRITDLETELPDMQRALDTLKPKLELLEELALRNERRIQEFGNTDRERRDGIQQFIDQQTLVQQQRDQQIKGLMDRFGNQDSLMQQNIERFEAWAETHREMRRVLDDFERISDRLERRIHEVAETQRLSEERFRGEWNDWRSDEQKRSKQFVISNDEAWRLHDKEFERFVQRIAEIEGLFTPILESLNRIWRLERERAKLYRDGYQTLLMEHDTGRDLPLPASVRVHTNGTATNGGSHNNS